MQPSTVLRTSSSRSARRSPATSAAPAAKPQETSPSPSAVPRAPSTRRPSRPPEAYAAPAARGVGAINAPTIQRTGRKMPHQNRAVWPLRSVARPRTNQAVTYRAASMSQTKVLMGVPSCVGSREVCLLLRELGVREIAAIVECHQPLELVEARSDAVRGRRRGSGPAPPGGRPALAQATGGVAALCVRELQGGLAPEHRDPEREEPREE